MLIDAHCHLDRYRGNLERVLEEIKQHRIFTISNSMDLLSYRQNVRIAAISDFVLPVFGVHPWNALKYIGRLRDLDWAISESPIIGEIGLDHYFVKGKSRYDYQREVFDHFLKAATKQKKIVIVHTKGAERETFQFLKQHNVERVIIHWYSGPFRVLKAMVEQGFYFTIGVEVLSSQHIQNVAEYLPAELMLTETDNPGGNESITGTRGTPLLVKEVIRKVAEIRGTSDDVIATTVHNNLIRIGNNDAWLAKLLALSG
jgi:TatD DNase family protein